MRNAGSPEFRWTEGAKKTAIVSLAFDPAVPVGARVTAGTPVIAIFRKRTTNDILHAIAGVLSEARTLFAATVPGGADDRSI